MDLKSGKYEIIVRLPMSNIKRILCRFRLFERLLRLDARNGIMLSEAVFLFTFNGTLFRLDVDNKTLTEEKKFENGMNNPMGLTLIRNTPGFDDCIVYGEYLKNEKRKNSISVFKRPLSAGEWEKVFEFKPGEIRHIHGIKAIDGNVYLLTGDFGKEAGIWKCEDNFKSVSPMLVGQQKYRTVQMFGLEDGLIFASDSAIEANHIYIEKNGEAADLTLINGSCLSGAEGRENFYFSTTVEADESIRGFRSWFNRKRGAGILSNACQIVAVSKKDLSVKKILEYEKDRLPYKLFQYGHFGLYYSESTDELLVFPVATKKHDGDLLSISEKDIV